jgi:hypothetical protein
METDKLPRDHVADWRAFVDRSVARSFGVPERLLRPVPLADDNRAFDPRRPVVMPSLPAIFGVDLASGRDSTDVSFFDQAQKIWANGVVIWEATPPPAAAAVQDPPSLAGHGRAEFLTLFVAPVDPWYVTPEEATTLHFSREQAEQHYAALRNKSRKGVYELAAIMVDGHIWPLAGLVPLEVVPPGVEPKPVPVKRSGLGTVLEDTMRAIAADGRGSQ